MSSPSLADRPIGVAVLGSTGSIGRQALEVLAGLGNSHRVIALAAGRDADGLSEQARRFRPPGRDRDLLEVIVVPEDAYPPLPAADATKSV